MLTNQINKSLGRTDSNRVFFSASLTDWSQATYLDIQRVCPSDGKFAIGLARANRLSDNSVPFDALGNFAITYDTDPTDGGSYAYHKGRRIKYAQLEPSTRELATSGPGTGYSTVFYDDFSSETPGTLGGQNNWLDGSGNNAKPQVTSNGRLDMGSAPGASLVYRTGNAATTRLSATMNIGSNAGIGFAIGYTPGQAHWRFDFAPGMVVYVYVDPDGTETNIAIFNQTGIVPQGADFTATVTISNGTITTVSNGQTVSATIT
ncbi:hypothetical protein MHZ35_17880, partial [Sphingomonas sp. ACRSK]|nr:hypothetical protein [Sphingomonas sp. ACRSK]